MLTTHALLLLALLPQAAQVTLSPRLELTAGYDSNVFFDAAALPADLAGESGVVLGVEPELGARFSIPAHQSISLSYGASLQQLVAGEVAGETVYRHQAAASYALPPLAGFRLGLGAAFAQLLFRGTDLGWWQLAGSVTLGRAITRGLRAQLGYRPISLRYGSGEPSSDGSPSESSSPEQELVHEAQAGLAWRLAPGWLFQAGYALAFGFADPDSFDSVRHGATASLRWRPVALPLEIMLGYHASLLELSNVAAVSAVSLAQRAGPGAGGQGSGSGGQGQGPGPQPVDPATVATDTRRDLLHGPQALLRVFVWKDLYAFARYHGAIGSSNSADLGTFGRHTVAAGVGFALSWQPGAADGATKAPRELAQRVATSQPALLQLSVAAPAAKKVSLVGSFNAWDPSRHPLQPGAEGIWRLQLRIPEGPQRYMLWIDGEISDPPDCARWVPDGFGGRNCALEVPRGGR